MLKYSKDNPYNDYSVYLHDLTNNGDEYFNEQICTEYKLKHNYYMVNEQISFYTWERDMRKSYINTYHKKNKHLISRVIIDMTFSIVMTAWFIYLIYFFAAVGMGAFGVYLELVYICIGIIPAMSYGLSTLLEYLTTKEISIAVRISKFLGRSIPGNELKDLHIELASLERKIIDLEDLSELLYSKVELAMENTLPFFMDRDTPFELPCGPDEYKKTFFKLTLDLESLSEKRKALIKERDDLLFQHKYIKEKTIIYSVITILAYVLYFTTYYNLPESMSFVISIGGFMFVLFPLIVSSSKLLFQYMVKEEFIMAMDIQSQIENIEQESKNILKKREELKQ